MAKRLYGKQNARQVAAYFPLELIAAVKRDVIAENVRAGDPEHTSFSARLAFYAAKHLGVTLPQPEKKA